MTLKVTVLNLEYWLAPFYFLFYLLSSVSMCCFLHFCLFWSSDTLLLWNTTVAINPPIYKFFYLSWSWPFLSTSLYVSILLVNVSSLVVYSYLFLTLYFTIPYWFDQIKRMESVVIWNISQTEERKRGPLSYSRPRWNHCKSLVPSCGFIGQCNAFT